MNFLIPVVVLHSILMWNPCAWLLALQKRFSAFKFSFLVDNDFYRDSHVIDLMEENRDQVLLTKAW